MWHCFHTTHLLWVCSTLYRAVLYGRCVPSSGCKQVEAELVSNSRNKVNRAWEPTYSPALYFLSATVSYYDRNWFSDPPSLPRNEPSKVLGFFGAFCDLTRELVGRSRGAAKE